MFTLGHVVGNEPGTKLRGPEYRSIGPVLLSPQECNNTIIVTQNSSVVTSIRYIISHTWLVYR